ncbi:hypothetical protein F5890DRAFT_1472729 [Lentinula detonsa]|uniref:DUF6534 domain-containing protein n=1 Tax=Lentinula detonsa TaxID=2804962 RepID=A0AA38Q3N1_9AGAR|nr:hypothetical protein F5890DRAFT_1472729 [Lentinula detonsa]
MSYNVRSTLGAAFAGSMIAVGLGGYVCTSVWQYLIVNYENFDIVKRIFPLTNRTVAITVAMTAVITLSVNSFYAWRIHKSTMSKHNWWLTGPIAFLSVVRVVLAFTCPRMITKTFPDFAAKFRILFTSGLFVSAVTDIIISVARYYYLRNLKQGYLPTQEVVDAVVVFTINDGFLTCAVVIASIGCWLGMPHNFVYLGIYFTISKFYSNSVLATLNLRNWYRHQYTWNHPLGLSMIRATNSDGSRIHAHERATSMLPTSGSSPSKHAHPISIDDGRVEVYVEHQVEYNVGNLIPEDLDVLETRSNKSQKVVEMGSP